MSVRSGDEAEVSITPVGDYTVVHDLDQNRAIMRIQGILPLPIGAEIELVGHNAKVVGVRLLQAVDPDPAYLCLDVRLRRV